MWPRLSASFPLHTISRSNGPQHCTGSLRHLTYWRPHTSHCLHLTFPLCTLSWRPLFLHLLCSHTPQPQAHCTALDLRNIDRQADSTLMGPLHLPHHTCTTSHICTEPHCLTSTPAPALHLWEAPHLHLCTSAVTLLFFCTSLQTTCTLFSLFSAPLFAPLPGPHHLSAHHTCLLCTVRGGSSASAPLHSAQPLLTAASCTGGSTLIDIADFTWEEEGGGGALLPLCTPHTTTACLLRR